MLASDRGTREEWPFFHACISSAIFPLRSRGRVPPMPPSLQPPMNSPLTKVCGTELWPVRAMSDLRVALSMMTTSGSKPAAWRAEIAWWQKGQVEVAKTTMSLLAITSSMSMGEEVEEPIMSSVVERVVRREKGTRPDEKPGEAR